MGTQQLLLIVVGTIVVALAIYAGINLVGNYFEDSNRDQLITTLNDLSVFATEYYKKPSEHGGGGGSYSGWTLPKQFKKTDIGKFRATIRNNRINFTATGTVSGENGSSPVRVTARLDNRGFLINVRN